MAFHQRKLDADDSCSSPCRPRCKPHDDCRLFHPPPPPPPPPPPSQDSISPYLVLMFCVIGVVSLLLPCYFIFGRKYGSNLNNSRRRNPPTLDDTHEYFIDENQGPVVDHPIWLINTVGLQQSVIDSIVVFKYKRDEGLIEGTECSVCLNEFQEDESLRLLPKCSHAFHIPCIDTWLRSHKNCPLCRAPIVSDANNAHVSTDEPNLNELGSREEIQLENQENYGGLGNHQVGEDGTSEMRAGAENFGVLSLEQGKIAEILETNSRLRNCEVRVLSDLADHRVKVEGESEPVRRSISMDSLSAAMIYHAVANIRPVEREGCSDTRLVQVKNPNSDKAAKRGNRNLSLDRLIKSATFGRSLQKGPTSMKRSFSSSRKCSLPRYSRSQDSILPL